MKIETISDFRNAARNGPRAWPGGYPCYFITSDGGALSFESMRENRRLILEAIHTRDNTGGWRVVGLEVNWENPGLYCDDSGKRIESAYAEPD